MSTPTPAPGDPEHLLQGLSRFGDRPRPTWRRMPVVPLLRYLVLSTETHAFCAALAFFALVAFYPLCSLLLTLCKNVLGWPEAYGVLVQALREYYPQGQGFLLRNLEASVAAQGRHLQAHGVVFILLGAAGFFVPLETAFNRLWGAHEHRSYWKNQAVGFALTTAGCLLALGFLLITAWAQAALAGGSRVMRLAVLRGAGVAAAGTAIYLFYRFLPNHPVRSREVLPAALLAGVIAEVVRAGYLLVLPWMALDRTQGPYQTSISFVLLAYVEAFVILGGAFIAAERAREVEGAPTPPSFAAPAEAPAGPD